jgi:hypothetical protein
MVAMVERVLDLDGFLAQREELFTYLYRAASSLFGWWWWWVGGFRSRSAFRRCHLSLSLSLMCCFPYTCVTKK